VKRFWPVFVLLAVVWAGGVASAGGWLYSAFDDNIDISWTPQAPNNLEPVNVTIDAKWNQTISLAYLYYNVTEAGEKSPRPGGPYGLTFAPADGGNARMYAVLPRDLNTAGRQVEFFVGAYDELNQGISSGVRGYTVAANGTWRSAVFSDELSLSFSPAAPGAFEPVNITITGKHQDIPIARVDFWMVYQAPGGKWSSPAGGATYIPLSATSGYAVIGPDASSTPNLPGYNVSFWAEVFDTYGLKLTSPRYNYTVSSDNPDPNVFIALEAYVWDQTLRRPLDGAEVTFSNATWSSTVKSSGGRAFPNPPYVRAGTYTVEAKYRNSTVSREVILSASAAPQVVRLDIRTVAGIYHSDEPYPGVLQYAIFLAAIILPPAVAVLVLGKMKREREALAAARRKTGAEPAPVPRWRVALWDGFLAETRRPRHMVPICFLFLGLLGGAFIPFYPLWMVLLIGCLTAVLAFRYPYMSLIILSLFVAASAGYQSPEFGVAFLSVSMVILMVSFFDWRFGYLVMFTLFLSRFGAGAVGPVAAVLLLSPFMGIVVAAVSGLLCTFFSAASSTPIFGNFPSAAHDTSFMLFTAPVKGDFIPGDIGAAFQRMGDANLDSMSFVINSNLGMDFAPFILILAWCLAFFVLRDQIEKHPTFKEGGRDYLRLMFRGRSKAFLTASSILLLSLPFAAAAWRFGYLGGAAGVEPIGAAMLLLGQGLVAFSAVLACIMVRDIFSEYYISKIGTGAVGQRISDMATLAKTSFEQVGGLKDVKEDIKESMIVPLLRPDISEQFGIEPAKGVLLFGAPGCGKTMLMKALATELKVEMINVKCSDLMSKWYGESEGKIAELFRVAKERKPCILFFDEIDAIAKSRDLYSADDVTPRILSIMLSELDGMDKAAGIIVVGSTNKPDLIDPALLRPGRFDKIIYVPPPDIEERRDIYRVHTAQKPLEGEIDLVRLAKETERFSGADIANHVKEAATAAMRRSLRNGVISAITMDDFLDVLPRIRPSISPTMIDEYERIKTRYERKMHDIARAERRAAVSLSDVGGLDEQKKLLTEYIELPLKRRALVERFKLSPSKGIVLVGPDGCGKTQIVKALASDAKLPVHSVSGIELANALATGGEEALRILWTRARDTAPSVILIVDVDALASRGSSYDHLVPFMDELDPSEKVVVVATTEKPEGLDPALLRPGRFERVVYIPPPDLEARQKILGDGLRGVPLDGNVDVSRLAQLTDGYSGENLVMAVNEAKLSKLKDVTGEETVVAISQADIERALNKIAPSVKPEVVESCRRFAGLAPLGNGNGMPPPEALVVDAAPGQASAGPAGAAAAPLAAPGPIDTLLSKIKDIREEDR